MTTYSDDFNRPDTSGLGANWSGAGFNIVSNRAVGASGSTNLTRYASAASTNDNFSQATIAVTAAASTGIATRMDSGSSNFYFWRNDGSGHIQLFKSVGGVATALGSAVNNTLSNNDVIKIVAQGSTITGYVNGTQTQQVTDTAVTTGVYGGLRDVGTTVAYDNWSGGDVSSTVSVTAVTATGSAAMPAPTVTGGASVVAVTATASGSALAPTVTTTAQVTAVTSTGTGSALQPTVTGGAGVTSPAAVATCTFLSPTLTAGANLTIPTATATADMLTPTATVAAAIVKAYLTATVAPEQVLVGASSATRLGQSSSATRLRGDGD